MNPVPTVQPISTASKSEAKVPLGLSCNGDFRGCLPIFRSKMLNSQLWGELQHIRE